MRIPLTQYPGMNKFVLDWLHGDERFLRRSSPPVILSEAKDPLRPERRGSFASLRMTGELVDALVASNKHWGLFVGDALRQWATGETLTVIAGQQVGFAGGPLYTLAKIASLIRFKRDMEKQGIPVTAFFWLATEDHDFDEAAALNVPVPGRQLDLLCIRAARTADPRSVVGPLPVPEELVTELLALYNIPRPTWLRQGITFGDSFAEFIASVFGNEIILVDSLLPELRRAGASLFDGIDANRDAIQHALHERGRELEAAGYKEQVIPRDGNEYSLLFEIDEHGHRRPPTANRTPERTSTSALTRPLLQDFVFQPDIFIGGPAEVAYYAQISVLHDLLGVPMPRVALRGHVLVAPKRVARAFERYHIDPAEVFASPDRMLAEREPEGVRRIQELTADAKRDFFARIEQISELALPADHSLAGSIERSIGHLEYHFDKLAQRAIKGLVRKDRERYTAVRELVATLYPDGHVQDRIVSWFAWWHRYGDYLVQRVIENVEPDSVCFKIVDL